MLCNVLSCPEALVVNSDGGIKRAWEIAKYNICQLPRWLWPPDVVGW